MTTMRIPILLMLLVLLPHGYEGSPTGQKRKSTFDFEHELAKATKNILQNLWNSTMIKPDKQVAFLLLGDKTPEYFASLTVNPVGLFISETKQPDSKLYDNFLGAIPTPHIDPDTHRYEGEHTHAESLLLGQALDLCRAYKEKHRHYPGFLLLYSDVIPCDSCTKTIISTKDYLKVLHTVEWFVIYRKTKSKHKGYYSEENIQAMAIKNIRVLSIADNTEEHATHSQ